MGNRRHTFGARHKRSKQNQHLRARAARCISRQRMSLPTQEDGAANAQYTRSGIAFLDYYASDIDHLYVASTPLRP